MTVDEATDRGEPPLQPTALTSHHEAAGAKLGPFAGWSMPIRFAGTLVEHAAVREDVGVFDVSHLGTVWVDGPEAEDVIAATFTNDPGLLTDGTSQYTLCCDDDGGIVDDLIVYRLGLERWLTVPNAANNAAVVAALEAAAAERAATVRDEGPGWAVLAVQGPRSLAVVDEVLAGLGARPRAASGTSYLGVVDVEVAGADGVLCRTGYTGEPGCELVLPAAVATTAWEALTAAGAEPCGLGARDTLRLEMGYPLHGNDLGIDTDPFEARLGWAVKLERGGFRGADALAQRKAAGPARRLWGLAVDGRRPVRPGMPVLADGDTVGVVTSGTASPTLGRPIALAYLADPLAPGAAVEVDLRGTIVAAEVVRPPFVARDPRAGDGAVTGASA